MLLSRETTGATDRVYIKNSCFNVTVADTPAARGRGLMFVTKLNPDAGMLFIFAQSDVYPFWMKNTLIPLDIIWLDENKKIVFIKNNAQPCGADVCLNIVPPAAARYVLEVNANTAERLNWESGDVMQIK
ncbi:hypothetical protein A2477_01915 [Candidatus Falkowbacteria bacterium RIFOXYC2_FULL_47_12]|uniref:DUF192 domain-containing protein n=1 Tax=Candidatus Falkowbacteria bacterium RIFOXYC2_FULL_47_12 TaxID=1798004 RepID=A0A1F5TNA5_9BACT|nr:MAG: hypothetical protein A2477_01915 [Candidatus Falkowbacteria bacterium RIFOXYC2_FULL_47_12]